MQRERRVTTSVRRWHVLRAAWLAAALTAGAAHPQTPTAPAPQGDADSITLNFQDADIEALINTVSQLTGRNFVVDPRVKGKVTLVSGGRLPAKDIYDVFLSVLEVHNFAAVPSGDVIKIVPSNIVKQHPTRTSFARAVVPNDEQLTQVVQLEHSSVQELVPILRPLLPPTSHFAAHAATNTLVFTDTAANIRRVLDIVGKIDVPDRSADVHVVYLKHATATVMAPILSQISTSITPAGENAAQARSISVQADDSINALVIQAPETEFRLMHAVVEQLDIERPDQGDIHVVYLKYATATDLVGILDEIIKQQGEEEENRNVTVQADEDMNALVIRAKAEQFRDLQAVIEKLDLRRSQVFVETIIAEVSTNKASELGVEWQALNQGSDGSETSVRSGFSASSDTGITFGFINRLVEDLAGNLVPDLSIVLKALRSDSNTNILSTPNLLTLDNETAEIVVGQEVPFITGQFVSEASSTSTDPDTSSSVVNPFQTIERKDVGLTLRLTPQINEGGAIRLEIEQEISSVSPITVQGASDLITDTRSIKATVQVDDGRIIVLGGLIRDDVQDTFEWVPILGKIPLLGALFRKKTKSAVKTNLMVFLRPKIVRSSLDLAGFTREKYGYIQTQERASLPDSRRMIRGVTVPILPDVEWIEEPPAPAAPTTGAAPRAERRRTRESKFIAELRDNR